MAWSSTADSPSSARKRVSASATAASLDCKSSNLTRSACIDVASPHEAFQQFLRKPHRDLLVHPGALLHERVEGVRRHREVGLLQLSVEQRELAAKRPDFERAAGT